ncbi:MULTISPECIES: DNA polymerase III subunit chi [unclassified Sphingomonas]|uniref:DNA polymerase III subunit chi n=1 Tax=unclassified Sphingomonas TaxID=196159 RepID=UPI00082E43F0|nr:MULTISPECIES: DNA polymerase III subunit chi [unclassified Sphingomonas]
MKVDFYHLTRQPLDAVLPRIAEKVLADGGRLEIVAGDAEQRAAIDRFLWTWSAESFLPHAIAGAMDDARQPILIRAAIAAPDPAGHVAIADGHWRDEALGFARAFHFFDDATIAESRAAWKALATRDGVERRYWKQNAHGRWEQAA